MTTNQIEQQIEALPPVEQIMMLERIARHLKQLLLVQPIAAKLQTPKKRIVEKLNQVYSSAPLHQLDPHLFNAQLTSIGRDEWQ